MGHRWVGRAYNGLNQDSALKNLAAALHAAVVRSTVSVYREVKTEIPAELRAVALPPPPTER
jgi:hypothetical protein